MRKIFTILFAVVCIAQSFGQTVNTSNYTQLAGPYGGSPSKIVSGSTTSKLVGLLNSIGIVISSDGGNTWTVSNSIITNLSPRDIMRDDVTGKLYVLYTNALYSSTDDGVTWTLVANSGFTNGMFIRKNANYFFIVGSNKVVYRSLTGATWTSPSGTAFTSASGSIRDFTVASNGYLFIAFEGPDASQDKNGVYRSANNGLGFDHLGSSVGLTNSWIRSLLVSGTTIYALSEIGPFKSTNNGTAWTSASGDITETYFDWFSAIDKDPSGNLWIFDSPKIWKSTNGGVNWVGNDNPTGNAYYADLRGRYFNSATQFIVGVGSEYLARTTDGGLSWINSSNGLRGYQAYDMKMTASGRILVNKGQGITLSIDDGASWDELNTDPLNRNFYGMRQVGSTLFAFGDRIVKSTNSGSTWTTVADRGAYYLATSDGVTVYNLDYDYTTNPALFAIEKSVDGGVTWLASDKKAIPSMPNSNSAYYPDYDNYYVTASGSVLALVYNYSAGVNRYQLWKINPDNGNAVEIVVPSGVLQDIDYQNGKLYVSTNAGLLYISSDDGATWTSKAVPMTGGYARVHAISDNTIYYSYKVTLLSIDGGNNWSTTATFPGLVKDVIVSAANYAYVFTEYYGIYRSNSQVIPPTAPTTLVSFGRDRNSIGLFWNDNSSTEDYFLIEASEGNNTNYDSVGTATRPNSWNRAQGLFSFFFMNGAVLKPNTTYFIRVRAVGSGGTSGPSNEISVTTLADCSATSSFPQNRSWTATTLNTSGIGVKTALNQTLTGGAGFYTIQDLPIGANTGLSPTPPANLVSQFEENCGSVFLSNINGYLSNGNGTWDPVTNTLTIPWITHPQYPMRTETTQYVLNAVDPVPTTPANFSALPFLPGQVLLNWNSGIFTAEFELERSLTSGSGFVKIATITFPTISYKDTDPALVPGTTYFYRIRGKNATGTSAYTSEVSIQPSTNYLFMPMVNTPGKTFFRTGGGGAWGDVDGDGIEDLILPVVSDSLNLNELAPQVFKSLGNGQFTKMVIPELVTETAASRGINIVDVNNDGRNDIYVSRQGTYDMLFIKQANGTYTKTQVIDPLASKGITSSSWSDYDKDNDLDLLITGRVNATIPETFLYNNDGTGALTRVTTGELVTDPSFPGDAEWADYDNDGDQDVIVINQSLTVKLYQNNGDGTFTRVLGSAFESVGVFTARSASWGDYDNDGFLDVFIASLSGLNKLFRNLGDGTFSEVVGSAVADASIGFASGSGWADLDNDQDLDLVVSGTSPAIFYNNGNGTFTKYASQELVNATNLAKFYGVAFNDVDDDGFLDFLYGGFSNPDLPNAIFRNGTTSSASTKWLKVKLVGTVSNRSAVGARLTLTAGTKTQIREVQSHTGHSSQSSVIQHIGLGANSTVTTLVIKWPSGIVQTLTNIPANQTITIPEDGAGPVFATLLPANGGTNVSSATKLEITLDENATAVAGKKIKVVKVSDPATTVFEANVTTATKVGNVFSFTLPAKLALSTAFQVTLDAGSFIDVYSNASAAIAAGSWNFTTGSGPSATALSPASTATNVAVNTALEITFDRAITAVGGKKLKIKDGATIVADIDVSLAGTIAGNKYTLPHPGANFAHLKLLEVEVEAGAFVDANQNDFGGLATGQWTFTTIEAPDVTKPVLTVDPTPLNSLDKGFAALTFSITATDNKAVTSVSFKHRKVSVKDFTEAAAAFNAANSKWELQVTNSFADDMGFEYFVEARDAAGNKARLPLDTTQHFRSTTQFGAANPTITIPGGGTAKSWKIIALPFVVPTTQVSQIFADLGTAGSSSWRLLRYQHDPQKWLEFPTAFNTMERGQGYFINAIESKVVTLSDPVAPTNTRDNLFTINLTPGWNLIGNPYTVTINWDDVIAYNNVGTKVLKLTLFTNGTYTENPELLAGVGGFVFANEAVSNLKIPFKGQTSGGRTVREEEYGDLASGNWLTKLKLSQGELTTEFGGVGMSPDASNSFDGRDGMNPPRFLDYVEMNFGHPEHFARAFARDVVQTQNEYEWSFNVTSNQEGLATMSWDNTGFGENAKDLFLMDVNLQQPINMRTVGSYTFNPKQSTDFKIFYGEDLEKKVRPSRVVLGNAFPNPTTSTATIPFTLPESNSAYHVNLEVFDMVGRKVGTVVQGEYAAGFYQAEWNASEALTNGLYVYRLTVSSGDTVDILSNKLIFKK